MKHLVAFSCVGGFLHGHCVCLSVRERDGEIRRLYYISVIQRVFFFFKNNTPCVSLSMNLYFKSLEMHLEYFLPALTISLGGKCVRVCVCATPQ